MQGQVPGSQQMPGSQMQMPGSNAWGQQTPRGAGSNANPFAMGAQNQQSAWGGQMQQQGMTNAHSWGPLQQGPQFGGCGMGQANPFGQQGMMRPQGPPQMAGGYGGCGGANPFF